MWIETEGEGTATPLALNKFAYFVDLFGLDGSQPWNPV